MQTAIVAEGGGQRGIYTAGVLDAFLQVSFNPFDSGIGVSAGAQNLLTYFLEQPGYARRAIAELTASPDFFVPYRWVGARDIIDLDGYFQRTQTDKEYRLPYQEIEAVQKRRSLTFVASDRETLEPVYLLPDASNVVDHLKASSAVPFLYRSGVAYGQRVLVDGGVADPLPIERAYEQGARRILLIRTAPVGSDCVGWRERLEQVRRLRALPASMIRMLEGYEQACSRTAAFLNELPADLQLHVIAPAGPLASQLFGSRSESLVADYRAGQSAGVAALDELATWADAVADAVADVEAAAEHAHFSDKFIDPDVVGENLSTV